MRLSCQNSPGPVARKVFHAGKFYGECFSCSWGGAGCFCRKRVYMVMNRPSRASHRQTAPIALKSFSGLQKQLRGNEAWKSTTHINGLSMLINLIFSRVDHRDQRCRKHVIDGLIHCMLYGVQRLEMDSTRVMRMCYGLKETNPRGWNQIFSKVKVILEEER